MKVGTSDEWSYTNQGVQLTGPGPNTPEVTPNNAPGN